MRQIESEVKVILPEQTFWQKSAGLIQGIVLLVAASIFIWMLRPTGNANPEVATTQVATTVNVHWYHWIPFCIMMLLVVYGMVMVWKNRAKIKADPWWKEKSENTRLWSLYIIVTVLTITTSYVAPNEYRYESAAVVALLGLHFIWGLFPTKEVGNVTKFFITAFLLYFISVGLNHDVVDIKDTGLSITKKMVGSAKKGLTEVDENYGKTPASQQGGIPASIVAVREKPSDWIRFAEHKTTAYRCTGDGMIYVRHNKTGPEGIGPFPCTPNGISRDLNLLQNGERVEMLEYLEVRFQSNGEPFLVNFLECPTNTSCLMRVS